MLTEESSQTNINTPKAQIPKFMVLTKKENLVTLFQSLILQIHLKISRFLNKFISAAAFLDLSTAFITNSSKNFNSKHYLNVDFIRHNISIHGKQESHILL